MANQTYPIDDIPLPPHAADARLKPVSLERATMQQLKVGQSFAFDPPLAKRLRNAAQSERQATGRRYRVIGNRCYRVK